MSEFRVRRGFAATAILTLFVLLSPVAAAAQSALTLLPGAPAFDAPLADPLKPRFAGAIATTDIFTRPLFGQQPDAVRDGSLHDSDLHGIVTLGAHVPLLGLRLSESCHMTGGVEASVTARFRLRTTEALSNDWWAGTPVAVACGTVSAQVRAYHRSDHLNDEFLLLNPMTRRGPVQDGIDATAAWQFHDAVRLYAGAGRILRGYWGPFGSSMHGGLELRRETGRGVRVLGALHVRSMEATEWRLQRVFLAGLEYHGGDGVLRLTLRDLQGPSTLGEFFRDEEHMRGLEITVMPGGSRHR